MANRSVRPGGRAGSQPISRVRAPEPVVTPINELVPVTANPVLRGIVTKKQTLRTFRDRADAPNNVFSFVMQDASGSIRVTCWKSAAVALVNLFSTADLIQLSGPMQVKSKKHDRGAYTTTSEYEVHIDSIDKEDEQVGEMRSIAVLVDSRAHGYEMYRRPVVRRFSTSSELKEHVGQTLDVCGVVSVVHDPRCYSSKRSVSDIKQRVILADRAGFFDVTFWGEENVGLVSLLSIKSAVFMYDLAIGQYRDNVQCSFNFKSQLLLQPHFPYASDLVRWAASSLRTIPDYFLADQSAVATVTEEDIVDYYTIAALGSIPIERNTLSYGFIVASLCSVRVPAERRYECPECRMMLADQLHCNTRSCSQFGRDLGASRSDSWVAFCTFIDESASIDGIAMFGSVAFRLLSIAGMTDDEELRNERLLWRKYKVSLKVTQDQSGEARYTVIGCSPASVADLQLAEAAKYNKRQRA